MDTNDAAGDAWAAGFVVPWSGEVIPLDPLPIPIAPPGTNPPIPQLHNPIPVLVDGVEYGWDDVKNFGESAYDAVTSLWSNAGGITRSLVDRLIKQAMATVQTEWQSFVSQLEQWTTEGLYDVSAGVLDLAVSARKAEVWLWNQIQGLQYATEAGIFGAVQGIEGELARDVAWLGGAIDNLADNIKTWAIDNIETPLLQEIHAVERAAYHDLRVAVEQVEGYVDDAVNNEALRRLAAVGAIAAAVAGIASWIEECGEPTCEFAGPNSDLGKLFKALQLAELLALLDALVNAREGDVQDLVRSTVNDLGRVVQAFDAFFGDGTETLGDVFREVL